MCPNRRIGSRAVLPQTVHPALDVLVVTVLYSDKTAGRVDVQVQPPLHLPPLCPAVQPGCVANSTLCPSTWAPECQIVRLAGGMRHVALSFDSEEAVAESVAFLRRAFPLGHTAPIKKSQVGQGGLVTP